MIFLNVNLEGHYTIVTLTDTSIETVWRNIAVEWVPLLFSVRETMGSNIGPKTGRFPSSIKEIEFWSVMDP
jgi:hypothetical protein